MKNKKNRTLEDNLLAEAAKKRRQEKWEKWDRTRQWIFIVCAITGVAIGLASYFKG